MRSRFRRPQERVFRVDLTIHQLDSIPLIHRPFYVTWRARRATPSEGRTPSQPVEHGNKVRWNTSFTFTIAIPSDPGDPTMLQATPLSLLLRSERRARWVGHNPYQSDGRVELDLSEVAAVGSISRNYLVQDSLLNTTLKISARLTHQAGDKIFRTRTLPQNSNSTISARNVTPGSSAATPNVSMAETAPHLAAVATPNPDDDTPPPNSDILSVPPRAPSMPEMLVGATPPDRAPPLSALLDTSHLQPLPHASSSSSTNAASAAAAAAVAAMSAAGAIPPPPTHPGPPLQAFSTTTGTPLNYAVSLPFPSSAPPLGGIVGRHALPAASGGLEPDAGAPTPLWDAPNTPATVLQSSIPDPDMVQRPVYETMFQLRLRDGWPGHIVKSRVDADAAVDHAYAEVCAADGICVAAPTTDFLARRERQMMQGTRGALKRTAGPPGLGDIGTMDMDDIMGFSADHPTPVTQISTTRRSSGRSLNTMVRSNSLGDLGSLS